MKDNGNNSRKGPGRRAYVPGRDGGERDDRIYRGNGQPRAEAQGRYDNRGEGQNRHGRRAEGQGRFDDRAEGPGRYDHRGANRSNGPRVGRVATDVPKAKRVTGDRPMRAPTRREFVERDFEKPARRGEDLRRGGAYRAPGASGYRGRSDGPDYEPPEIPEDLAAEFTDVDFNDEHMLVGRNPIREALRAGRPMEKLLVASGDLSGAARDIVRMARDAGVIVQQVDRARLDQIYPAHQGMLAYVAAVPYAALEDVLAAAKEKGEDPFIVVLDGITDPHNLGAIIRSAECAGAHGVVVPERRAAGLGPAAAKAAAGALNHMPVARVKNLNRAIEDLKEAGLWIIGTALDGEDALAADLSGPIALVIGSEGDGIARLTLEKCDRTISLPMKGRIESLNASVAAGILMYEVVRARAK